MAGSYVSVHSKVSVIVGWGDLEGTSAKLWVRCCIEDDW